MGKASLSGNELKRRRWINLRKRVQFNLTSNGKQSISPDRSSDKSNRLGSESSPYLLQHAQNPVDWYPWGKEAFEKAKHENKPIFLSIGYSSCHWCHVMAHESFEDPGIAAILNENFVSIKVDREERPDVDEIYMNSVVAMTGSGGWPLNVFLTPTLEPFYGGTYFPSSPRYGMPSFANVIRSISQSWKSDRKRLVESASQMKSSLREMYEFSKTSDSRISEIPIEECYETLVSSFDDAYGGFGNAPKFPTPSNLFFLFHYYSYKKNKSPSLSLSMARKTLDGMLRGGIYDQVGGGFHRYSTDRYWLVPHFEKMLYDNALLISVYSEAYLLTKSVDYSRIIKETIDWAGREMNSESGGFYSAIDADSSEGEGIFYTWSLEDLTDVLSSAEFRAEEIELVSRYFSITRDGNFEGNRTILTTRPTGVGNSKSEDDRVAAIILRAKNALLKARAKRPRPMTDDKILTGWNGLMISALSKAYSALGDHDYLSMAESCAQFILENLTSPEPGDNKKLLRSFRSGGSKGEAVLEDYAFFINGLIDLYEAGFTPAYLEKAIDFSKIMIRDFYDEKGGGFFQTRERSANLIVRAKDAFDGALPSGNSIAAQVCLRLAEITGNEDYRKRATDTFLSFWTGLTNQPASFSQMLVALQFALGSPKEIVISGQKGQAETDVLLDVIRSTFLPNSVIVFAEEETASISPLVIDRISSDNRPPTVYVCSNFSCKLPSKTEMELRQALSE